MTSKLDAGPIYSFSEFAINSDHNAQTLRHDLAILGGELTSQSLLGIIDGSIESIPQESQRASYCAKINRLSGQIKWKKDTAQTIEQKIKAYYPWPGVFTHFNNKILKIHAGSTKSGKTKHPGLIQKINPNTIAIETKNGFFIPKIVQIEGKKAMPIEIFIQGYRNFVDTPLT
ncbi:MAG: methionyl-tRNA formyltransferase, methionyl-tRNA formyltransferase [Candidatus Peregrinibacteria bacterium GW2011_GWE2_39_6]|nr:MAG: methionyl-tRNA formyltransferase, methionyl-tRNA formyltransferase [Candidatus Peregrinibacteria bacterium GW2011_GWE2_39_6]